MIWSVSIPCVKHGWPKITEIAADIKVVHDVTEQCAKTFCQHVNTQEGGGKTGVMINFFLCLDFIPNTQEGKIN